MRPFRIDVPGDQVRDLVQRLEHTRWPDAGTTSEQSQGLPLDLVRDLVRDLCDEWAHGYDWRATETRLNAIG